MCFFLIVYTQSSSPDTSVSTNDLFNEPITVSNAYVILCIRLHQILQYCDLVTLKVALYKQVDTPDGVKLGNQLKKQIKKAKSSSELLNILERSHCCNCIVHRVCIHTRFASVPLILFCVPYNYVK